MSTVEQAPPKRLRGFARLSPEQRKEMARKGGKSVPNSKRSFSLNRDLAAEAGRKGGLQVKPKNRSFSRDHALASEAGRKGGKALAERRKGERNEQA